MSEEQDIMDTHEYAQSFADNSLDWDKNHIHQTPKLSNKSRSVLDYSLRSKFTSNSDLVGMITPKHDSNESSPFTTPRVPIKPRSSYFLKDDGTPLEFISSKSPSANSSRRPSFATGVHPIQGLKMLPTRQPSPGKVAGKSNTVTPVSTAKHSLSNTDITSSGPTLVLPPELASLKTQSTSNISLAHSFSEYNNSQHQNNIESSTSIKKHNKSLKASTRSLTKLNLVSTKSSSRKQQAWNEKLYLEKMQNYVPHDYYTRGIVASTSKDDDPELELEMDDMIGNTINNDDYIDFGTNFFTTNIGANNNNMSMSTKYLLHRLEWIKHSDPKNATVNEVFQNINNKSEFGKDKLAERFDQLSIDSQEILSKLSAHPLIVERYEWQTMLTNVLKGDIVKSEKSKIANQIKPAGLNKQNNEYIWIELKAWMNGKKVDDQRKSLKVLRDSTDSFFEDILSYVLPDDISSDDAEKIIRPLIERYYKIMNYWCNLKQMYEEKPITKTPEFINRVDALTSWLNFNANFESHINSLREWVDNNYLDVTQIKESSTNIEGMYESGRSFAERIMKEKGIEQIFQRKIFFPLAPWILKAKLFFTLYKPVIKDLNLVFPKYKLDLLLMFPMKLVKEVILVRLEYAKKLKNPTMMMIDEMIDDFTSYIRLSVQLKYTIKEYSENWEFAVEIDPLFDDSVMKAILYLFNLLNLKLLDSQKISFKTFKEPDELFKYWDELKNVGHYIEGAGKLIAKEFNRLSLRLLHKLHMYMLQEQNSPPVLSDNSEAEKWLLQLFENAGTTKRKLNRFTNILAKSFQNSMNFKIEDHNLLLKQLKDAGHFLIYTGGELEQNGNYIIGSPELLGCEDTEILRILNNSEIGCDLIPKMEIKNSLLLYNATDRADDPYSIIVQNFGSDGVSYYQLLGNEVGSSSRKIKRSNRNFTEDTFIDTQNEMRSLEDTLHSLGYILILSPSEPMLWEGEIYNLSDDFILKNEKFNIKVLPNHLTIINQGSSYALDYLSDRLLSHVGNCVSFVERKSSFSSVENGLQRINKAYFRITYTALNNFPKILNSYEHMCPGNELLNSIFLFTRDFGRNFLRVNVATYAKKSVIIMLLMRTSITWLSFLVEKCDPTDLRTFRWCVPAMEFAMQITNGWNILGLDEKQFATLKQKIAACMSLLISHFDVMGARAMAAERASQQIRPHIDIEEDVDDDDILLINSQVRIKAIEELEMQTIKNPRQIGKVLDDRDTVNKYLLSLASSMSNVSIRWQKRQFVGSGTFGNVYSAVNLGSGEILAVKEIKIQDSNAMKKVFPLIKEEMTVLEMLNHPNIVQYYGIEVHRDKVNIFMEFCEGGSMASLLEHGRIEDEMVTQMYSLELLEGLAYLHQSGIVHRDIKPENILLDFNGIIKYVDFGAARKIVENSTRVANMDSKSETDDESHTKSAANTKSSGNGIHNMVGTPMYMAPESITGAPNKGKFGADDVWSLGCVILEMVTGKRPWANLDNEWAIMYQVAAGHVPPLPSKDELSQEGMAFLSKAIIQNPDKRATAAELLTDPWIVEIRELAFGSADSETSTNTSLYEPEL